jgi:UDP-3-O-[3-hydroxymyristoyl] glucosamine N-acyltransferase
LTKLFENHHISCVITTSDIAERLPEHLAVAVCDDPKTVFYQIHEHLARKTDFYWKDFESQISPNAKIHETAYVAQKNVSIGNGTIVEPNAVIMEKSIVGEDVIIRSGAVIGGTGMEPKYVDGDLVNISHMGGVRLENRVEISGNSYIQRSVFGDFTKVGQDTKIGPIVNIGHHVTIGRCCEIAGCSVISGSTVIGDGVWIGPNSTISSEICVGDNARIHIGSIVVKDVKYGQKISGLFAMDHSKAMREYVSINRKRN